MCFLEFPISRRHHAGFVRIGDFADGPKMMPLTDQLLRSDAMLYWALIFLVVALIAAVFGFGGIASASAGIAQILFFIFLLLFVAGIVMHFVRGRAS